MESLGKDFVKDQDEDLQGNSKMGGDRRQVGHI